MLLTEGRPSSGWRLSLGHSGISSLPASSSSPGLVSNDRIEGRIRILITVDFQRSLLGEEAQGLFHAFISSLNRFTTWFADVDAAVGDMFDWVCRILQRKIVHR